MIRMALLLSLLATSAFAQTQGTLKAGDALSQCIQGGGGPLSGPEQFESGIATANDFGWIASEIGPGHYKLDRKEGASFGVIVEIKLTDADGTAYCLVYGPALQPGDAVTAADRGAAQGLMPQLTESAEPPPEGVDRYYFAEEGPIRYALMAYRNPNAGDVAGFVITGLPTTAPQQSQQAAPSGATDMIAAARANVAIGVDLCNRPAIPGEQRAALFRTAGFAERTEGSPDDRTHIFTAPAETATAEVYYGQMPDDCTVSSAHLGVTDAGAVLDQVIPRLYPGFVRKMVQGAVNPATGQPATCVSYVQPNAELPLVISTLSGTADACAEDGTVRIFSSHRV